MVTYSCFNLCFSNTNFTVFLRSWLITFTNKLIIRQIINFIKIIRKNDRHIPNKNQNIIIEINLSNQATSLDLAKNLVKNHRMRKAQSKIRIHHHVLIKKEKEKKGEDIALNLISPFSLQSLKP